MRIILHSFLLASFFCLAQLHAQVLLPRQYSIKDGLPHACVYRTFQDKQGFLWFSTDYGISRFDGTAFRNYNASLFGNSSVLSTAEYGNEKWVSTYGAGVYILANDSSTKPQVLSGSLPSMVTYTLRDKQNRTWISEVHGQLFLLSGKTISRVDKDIRFRKMIAAADGSIFFTCDKGIYRYTQSTGMQPYLPAIIREETFDICEAAPNEYWISAKGKILHLISGNIVASFYTGKGEASGDLMLAPDNSIWYCAPGAGVLRIINNQLHDYTAMLGLSGMIVNDIFCDREGNTWFATLGNGAFVLYAADISYFPVEKNKITLYANALTCKDNKIIIGSIGAVNFFGTEISRLPVKTLQPDEYVYCVATNEEFLFTGTSQKTIIRNMVNGHEEEIDFAALSWCKNGNEIWLGGYSTAAQLKFDGQHWFTEKLLLPRPRRINALTFDAQKQLWLGTDSGLYRYENGKFSYEKNMPLQHINCIFFDSHQRLWVAANNGLAVCENGKWKIFTTNDGLCNDRCHAIREDAAHKIWVGTMRGLHCITLRNSQYKISTPFLAGNDVLSLLITSGQVLWAGTVNGVISMSLRNNITAVIPPKVYVLNATSDDQSLNNPQQVELSWQDRKLLLQFVAPSFRNSEKIEYRYRMEGLSDDWTYTPHHLLEFSALPPGNYVFTVQARLERGEWGPAASVKINAVAPFWRTGWFSITSILLLICLLLFGMRYYFLKKMKQEKEKMEITNKMLHLRQQALTAMINPHFIFNCLNSIQYFINRKDTRGGEDYLSRFATLVRQTIEDTRETVISLHHEVRRLELYLELEHLRLGNKLNYSIVIPPGLENVHLPNMIIQPFVENAILHGIAPKQGAGHLFIRINEKTSGLLQIEIEDDGVGFSHDEKRRNLYQQHSLGMAITRERLELMSRMNSQSFIVEVTEKKDASGHPAGTLVKLYIPILPGSGKHVA